MTFGNAGFGAFFWFTWGRRMGWKRKAEGQELGLVRVVRAGLNGGAAPELGNSYVACPGIHGLTSFFAAESSLSPVSYSTGAPEMEAAASVFGLSRFA